MVRQSLRGKGLSPKKFFRVDKVTEEILNSVVNQSEFIRSAIRFFWKNGAHYSDFECEQTKLKCSFLLRKHFCPRNPFKDDHGLINPVIDEWRKNGYTGFSGCGYLKEKVQVYASKQEGIYSS